VTKAESNPGVTVKTNHVYRVVDGRNNKDLRVTAKSAGHAASQARRIIANHCGPKFVPWQTDSTTGGWHGVSIDMPGQNVVRVQRPTPRPERADLPWKRKLAA
jgi:hypothetical protein